VKLRRTRPAAWLALLAVFCGQLAIAAYACPLLEQALKAPAGIAEAATPCAEMGMAGTESPSALCLEHCKVGQQLVDNHSPVTPLAVAPVLLFFVQPLVADISELTRAVEPLLVRATAPPVFASSSRLRI
jgi:hypothetical protein